MKTSVLFSLPMMMMLAICSLPSTAQQAAAPKQQTGTVTGHVFFADTNTPGRMATVLLEPVVSTSQTVAGEPHGMEPAMHMSSVQTSIDGSFSFQHVAPGTYYVLASSPGYMTALASLGLSMSDLQPAPALTTAGAPSAAAGASAASDTLTQVDIDAKQKLHAGIPRVTVQANLPAAIDVSLERGAAVSGTVLFDDSAPASGLSISLLVHKKDKWLPLQSAAAPFSPPLATDDRGGYRLAGLAPGEYLVEVDLSLNEADYWFQGGGSGGNSSGTPYTIPVYSGDAFRIKTATPFTVKAGEDRPGEDIQIPLRKLHEVSGSIIAARDGHAVNGGSVVLLYADDRSPAAQARLTRDQPGFNFRFVADGDYLLQANTGDFEDEEIANPPGSFPATRTEEHGTHWYAETERPLHVEGNVSALTITVPEKPAKTQSTQ